jgi:hypothetical protein
MDSELARAVIEVGDGRGFIIQHRDELLPFEGERSFADLRLVITAAHCLPYFPPCHGMSLLHERTYKCLLGPLGGPKPDVWAECLFADPVGDIAVLGSPDNQVLGDEADAYEALTGEAPALRIGHARRKGPGWLLTLDGKWERCVVEHYGGPLFITKGSSLVKAGMSGSPILSDAATAIGIVCCDGGEGALNPRLDRDLPGWLLVRRRRQG